MQDVSTESFLVDRSHSTMLDDGNNIDDVTDSDDDDVTCYEGSVETDSSHQFSSLSFSQKSSALFLLGIKEKFKLTQSAIDSIVQGITAMNQQHISVLKSQVATCFSFHYMVILSYVDQRGT